MDAKELKEYREQAKAQAEYWRNEEQRTAYAILIVESKGLPEPPNAFFSVDWDGESFSPSSRADKRDLTRVYNYYDTKEEAELAGRRFVAMNKLYQVAKHLNGGWKPKQGGGGKMVTLNRSNEKLLFVESDYAQTPVLFAPTVNLDDVKALMGDTINDLFL